MQVNSTQLAGRLTRDPEVRDIGNGKRVASFDIASNRVFRTAAGDKKEETLFITVECFGNQADYVAERIIKSMEVYIDGYLKLDVWEDKNGNKRSKIKVCARSVQGIGIPAQEGGGDSDYQRPPKSSAQPVSSTPPCGLGEDTPF